MKDQEPRAERLSTQERQEIRRQLRALDRFPSRTIARIGRVLSFPKDPQGDTHRYRFGIGLIALAVFLLLFVLILPNDYRRWLFVSFAWLVLLIGAWQIDKAGKRRRPKI